MSNIKDTAREICDRLIDTGFTVHRYNAYSTMSIYIKVDCGLCKSIRVSDHDGKGYLRYTYNVRKDILEYYEEVDNSVHRYYFPMEDWSSMVGLIVNHRKYLIDRYGSNWYNMELNRLLGSQKTDKGFWSSAYLVKRSK